MVGDIMGIARLRMGTDGTGVTTLVTFFGCPLKCKYCINDFCHEQNKVFPFRGTPRGAYHVEELVEKLAQDEIYYLMSDGGITFGGGEPLLQAEFISKVCALANPKWKKRIETSLYGTWESIELLIDYMDEWIVDVKEMNLDIYKRYTGKSSCRAHSNLRALLEHVPAEKIRVRLPEIPGYNNHEDMKKSKSQLISMGITRIEEFRYIIT